MQQDTKKVEKSDGSKVCLDRRQCIGAAVGVVGLFALGAVAQGNARTLIRPPGAGNEQDFLSACIRCDRCRSVCPHGTIGVADLAQGLRNLRTPVMTFHRGYCDFCNRCIAVCPTGALRSYDGESVVLGQAELTDNCIALRTGACNQCVKACPAEAITLDAKKIPVIDAERCNGCGKCEQICPANIFQSYSGTSVRGIVIRPVKKGEM